MSIARTDVPSFHRGLEDDQGPLRSAGGGARRVIDLTARTNPSANPPETLANGDRVNLRFTDWIWHIKGSLALAPEQSSDEAFRRLDPLLRQTGTTPRNGTTNLPDLQQEGSGGAGQDGPFSIAVSCRSEEGSAGPVLHYRLASRTLLFCFLAPLLFLSFAGLTVAVGKFETPSTEKSKKKDDKKDKVQPQIAIEKFLGAPGPDKPKKDKKKEDDKKPKPTTAYVFAAIFAALYIVGRILEDRLIKSLFRKKLADS